MADLDFNPESSRPRRRQKPSKNDALAQSCSAFNFILEPDGKGKDNNRRNKNSRISHDPERTKPSYSDFIMDATFKDATSMDATSKTATASSVFVTKGGDEDPTDQSEPKTGGQAKLTLADKRKTKTRSARSVPSSNDISRRQILNSKQPHSGSKSPQREAHDVARSRRQLHGSKNPNRRSSLHMSMEDFPEPADFMFSKNEAVASKRRNDNLSKSCSGFDDWDPNEFLSAEANQKDTIAALTLSSGRRGGKKPLHLRKRHSRNNIKDDESSSKEFVLDDVSIDTFFTFDKSTSHTRKHGSDDDKDSGNNNNNNINNFEDSFTEKDLMNGLASIDETTAKKAPLGHRRGKSGSRDNYGRFSKSFSGAFDPLSDLTSITSATSGSSDPASECKSSTTRRRRSDLDQGLLLSSKLLPSAGVQPNEIREIKRIVRATSGSSTRDVVVEGDPRFRRLKKHDGSIRPIRAEEGDGGRRSRRKNKDSENPLAVDGQLVVPNKLKKMHSQTSSRERHSGENDDSAPDKSSCARHRRKSTSFTEIPTRNARSRSTSRDREAVDRKFFSRSKSRNRSSGSIATPELDKIDRRSHRKSMGPSELTRATKDQRTSPQPFRSVSEFEMSTELPDESPIARPRRLLSARNQSDDKCRSERHIDVNAIAKRSFRRTQSTRITPHGSRKPSSRSRHKLPGRARSHDESSKSIFNPDGRGPSAAERRAQAHAIMHG